MQVCLDGTTTTEKELDTVEVLKAIQKAKEAKDRMANNEKKVFLRFSICFYFYFLMQIKWIKGNLVLILL